MRLLLYIITFLLLLWGLFSGIDHLKQERIDEELRNYTSDAQKHYNVMYTLFQSLADTAFTQVLSRADVMARFSQIQGADALKMAQIRNEMYTQIKEDYRFYERFQFRQFHYHLKNNHSFLRMHAPEKYGDDLTHIRYSVRQTNATKTPQNGFEEGRVIHGFRFVYPLFDTAGEHLGSVEASLTAKAFIDAYEKSFRGHVHFIENISTINKKSFEAELPQYLPSIENSQYYFRHDLIDGERYQHSEAYKKSIAAESGRISALMAKHEAFSVNVRLDDTFNVVTFLPIGNVENQVVAYFVIYAFEPHLTAIAQGYANYKILGMILLALLFAFIYIMHRHRSEIETYNLQLENRVGILLEEERKKERILLRQSRMAQMGELLSMIAHQWRQPLTAVTSITAHMQLLNSMGTLEPLLVSKNLKRIDTLMENMSKVITRFRQFYQPMTQPEAVHLDTIVESSVGLMESVIEKLHISLTLELHITNTLYCYGVELEQVILNCLQNACDEFQLRQIREPRIGITTSEFDDRFEIRIEDNAGGIEPQHLEKVFDPYFSTKTDSAGTGLGLYMSQLIVERHCHGTITASNTDKGACFTVVLPRTDVA